MGGVGTVSRYLLITMIRLQFLHLATWSRAMSSLWDNLQNNWSGLSSCDFSNVNSPQLFICVRKLMCGTCDCRKILCNSCFTFYILQEINIQCSRPVIPDSRSGLCHQIRHQQVGSAGSGQDRRTGRQFAVIWSLKCSDLLLLMLSVVRAAVL